MNNKTYAFKYFILWASFIGLSICCNKENNALLKEKYSGESLFRGIMYGEGEVSKAIPQISLNRIDEKDIFCTEEEILLVSDIRNEILSIIKKRNPLFLTEFQQKIYSHDPAKIQEALELASSNIHDSLLEMYQIKTERDKEAFDKQLSYASKKCIDVNSDGSLNQQGTKQKVKTYLQEGQTRNTQPKNTTIKSIHLTDSENNRSKLMDLVLENSLKDDVSVSNQRCVAVIGVVVVGAVIAAVVVEAAAATDAWFWATSLRRPIKEKSSLYQEDFIASIAKSL